MTRRRSMHSHRPDFGTVTRHESPTAVSLDEALKGLDTLHSHQPPPELPLDAAAPDHEETDMAGKTASAPPTDKLATTEKAGALATAKPPAFVGDGLALSLEEWEAMDPGEQQAAIAFFQEELEETTRGVQVEFPRIKYPTSGSSFWEMKGLDGEAVALRQVEGIVVFKMPVRAYWPLDQEIANNPPACSSLDSVIPVDGPGKQARTCGECPRAQWGTGKDGRGQACKQRLNAFVMLPDAELPTLISLPPTALKAFGQHAVALRQAKVPLLDVTTVFGLVDAKSAGGIAYKGIALKLGRRLGYDEMKRARVIREAFEEQMARRGVRVDEAEDTTAEGHDDDRVIDGQAQRVAY